MSVRRIIGTEVEYGISVPGDPMANPMLLSAQLVDAYAATDTPRRKPAWDWVGEDPLADARGFQVPADEALDHTGRDADDDPYLANVVLTNGARFYVDHAHPEYSAPEVTNPRDAVLWDKAGERVVEEAARRLASVPGNPQISLYKNNTDNKGASYGTHENYLVRRSTPFDDLVEHLTPFFVTRQIYCGAGRVGIGQDGSTPGFQLSQRADFFEAEVGLETTLRRPIINTRDEPHATAAKYRRLHVIVGDANLAETSTYLKVGTAAVVLAMIEYGAAPKGLRLADPVPAIHAVSHDWQFTRTLALHDGRRLTALQIQREYLEAAERFMAPDLDPATAELLTTWRAVLDALESDPMSLADRLDWVAKLRLLEAYRGRDSLGWASPRVALVDLQYSDVRLDKGLYNRLVHRGAMRTLVDEDEVQQAMTTPPQDTRAYFRGECIRRFGLDVAAASWDSVVLDVGRPGYVRVPMMEPQRGTRAHVEELLSTARDAADLVDRLATTP
ncbi:depupylase/deamidase Dop [Blastococcus sp. Marseille-P5729]|uniref:depupylase/deamidase Dop n=1 Tax=Blastococcus sp. Marseille-P5729 TaxID=2086582 RepID=UPI000D0F8388|nr:depupylase/deamidase Dop [Blastococcus sp. Marseille-P5729]